MYNAADKSVKLNALIIKYLNTYFDKELISYPAFDIEDLYNQI